MCGSRSQGRETCPRLPLRQLGRASGSEPQACSPEAVGMCRSEPRGMRPLFPTPHIPLGREGKATGHRAARKAEGQRKAESWPGARRPDLQTQGSDSERQGAQQTLLPCVVGPALSTRVGDSGWVTQEGGIREVVPRRGPSPEQRVKDPGEFHEGLSVRHGPWARPQPMSLFCSCTSSGTQTHTHL